MGFNPLFDPFVETAYLGYSLRGVARRRPDRLFSPVLEVRDYRFASGDLMHESAFPETFSDADAAIERALGKGRQVVDDLLYVVELDERVES